LKRQAVKDIADELRVVRVHHHGMGFGIETDDAVTQITAHAHEHGFDFFAHALLPGLFPFRASVLEVHAG